MNRDQKAAAIAEIATNIEGSQAIFAVDYLGLSVPQAAELRAKLRDVDASFRVVKNSLTERAADQTGAEYLKPLLQGPTALTFVHGDAALAAKAIADYARATQLLPFKGGSMDGAALDADQIRSISRLPSREVLYGQLVGVVASPISGLVRTLNALVGGLAIALGQVREKKESGELPAGEPPAGAVASEAVVEEPAAGSEAGTPSGSEAATPLGSEAGTPSGSAAATPAGSDAATPGGSEAATPGESAAEFPAAQDAGQPPTDQAEPASEPAQDDNQADATAQAETAEANPKED